VRVCIAEGLRSLREGLRGVQYTVEYFTVMDETLRPIAADSPPPRGIRLRVLTAVRLSSARLIDNIGVHTHP
jgi:pantothenate synthetase